VEQTKSTATLENQCIYLLQAYKEINQRSIAGE